MKRLSLIALVAAFVVSAFAFLASSAFAIPVFARKYNTQCNMCHTVPPRLNKFGVAYKENGFELPPGTVLPESEVYGNQVLSTDEPKAIVGAGFPFMIRTGLNLHLANSTTTGGVAVNNPLSASLGEFGLIGGGAVETGIGGLGFWIDAPGAAIGAIDLDFNFNPLFKVAVGTDGPKVGYALALTPIYVGNNTRNPATQAVPVGGFGWVWGNGGTATVEVRGTTNPATGLGLNYAVGYGLPAGVGGPAPVIPAASGTAPSLFYGHVSYFIDAINSNIGIGFSSENDGLAVAGAQKANASQMLVDFAYGVGDNLIVTVTYNSVKNALATGAPTAGATTNYITVQPEFTVSPTLTVGGRYATAQNDAPGAAASTILSVGANYKLLQNVLLWGNYTSTNNGVPAPGDVTTSGLNAGLDFIF